MIRRYTILALAAAMLGSCENPAELPALIGSIDVQVEDDVLPLGATLRPTAVVRDRAGKELNGRLIIWSSSNEAVVTVDPDGIVTARAAGSAKIVARSGGRSGQTEISVPVPHYFLGYSTMYRAAGQPLPAVVFDDDIGDDEDRFHVRVVLTEGYLQVEPDARYRHVYTDEYFIDGNGPFRKQVNDRGDCRVTADRIDCTSSLVANVAFTGVLQQGAILSVRDLSGEGVPVPIEYAQMHAAQ